MSRRAKRSHHGCKAVAFHWRHLAVSGARETAGGEEIYIRFAVDQQG
jgi:hypothetical protein